MKKGLKLSKSKDHFNQVIIIERGKCVIGVLWADGTYYPQSTEIELTTDELKQILVIAENFQLFFNNL
jgi:hypothetical protein